jgi:hypothetical protein
MPKCLQKSDPRVFTNYSCKMMRHLVAFSDTVLGSLRRNLLPFADVLSREFTTFFTREYTQCTAGYTFALLLLLLLLLVLLGRPLVKLGNISANS